jgi:hypothetical protein
MSELKTGERAAIESVARRFSATWENGGGPADAYLTASGKWVAVNVVALKRRAIGQANSSKLRLRFDRVATRVIERLNADLGETVPKGMTVVLTITAPIRLPSKTIAALGDKITTLLGRRSPPRDEKHMIHGNHVRIRLLRHKSGRAPRMIGFVHNHDSDPFLLLNATQELIEGIGEACDREIDKAGDRWLVIVGPRKVSALKAYRTVYSQLHMPRIFEKIVFAFGDGRIGDLVP